MIGFALFSSFSFAYAFVLKGRKLLFALPFFVALAVFGYLCLVTEWGREYAGLLPILVGSYLGATLVATFLWVGSAHLVFRWLTTHSGALTLVAAAMPGLVAAGYVVWDQSVPQNECATSHLDVDVVGGVSYRVYPELRVRFDSTQAGDERLRFQARYSSLPGDKLALARLCRHDERIETARLWITPVSHAETVEAVCRTHKRAFCSHLDPSVMKQLDTVKIGRYDRSEIDYYLQWFNREQDSDVLSFGDAQDGALCQSVGHRFQSCFVWRRIGESQLGVAQTGQGAQGLSPEEMVAVAHEGLDQMLLAFSPPER